MRRCAGSPTTVRLPSEELSARDLAILERRFPGAGPGSPRGINRAQRGAALMAGGHPEAPENGQAA